MRIKRKYEKHGLTGTTEKEIWVQMKQRCNNPKSVGYQNYGGRGIKVLYTSLTEMINDIGMRPSLNHTIDRIDVNGNYEPGNVRWATTSEQNRNKRTNRWVTINGVKKVAVDWARGLGMDFHGFVKRVETWPESKLLDPPKVAKGYNISFSRQANKFRARLQHKQNKITKEKHVGYFSDKELAESACINSLSNNPNWYL